MDETNRLAAVCKMVEGSFCRPQVSLEGVKQGYVELYPTVDGVEYEIKISVRNHAEAARLRFEERRLDHDWRAKALIEGTPEFEELATLVRKMAGGS